jgi:hypothetical protein
MRSFREVINKILGNEKKLTVVDDTADMMPRLAFVSSKDPKHFLRLGNGWRLLLPNDKGSISQEDVLNILTGIDYKALLIKYIEHVGYSEGVTFIEYLYESAQGIWTGDSPIQFTEAERNALIAADEASRKGGK